MNEPKTFLRNKDYGTQFSEFPQNRVRLIEVTRRLVLGPFKEKKPLVRRLQNGTAQLVTA